MSIFFHLACGSVQLLQSYHGPLGCFSNCQLGGRPRLGPDLREPRWEEGIYIFEIFQLNRICLCSFRTSPVLLAVSGENVRPAPLQQTFISLSCTLVDISSNDVINFGSASVSTSAF
ncbi:hypothetical protein ATANTOWER_016486 [Ataeniobius toweri]|uniref:Uncharacterized protein n=1 Tax=Ataeniobius toweri TaxID=208326 RepID=A0ABU7A0J5_9TELE|nr:hypothetical protein [Ataeniobius toweri]